MLNVAALQGAPVSFTEIHPVASAVSAAQDAYIRAHDFDEPTVVFDLDMLRGKFDALAEGLGDASIHYAVKANPAPEVVAALAARSRRPRPHQRRRHRTSRITPGALLGPSRHRHQVGLRVGIG